MEKLVLEDKEGKVLRAFAWSGEPVHVIRRGDTRRLELVRDTQDLQKKKIPFEQVGEISKEGLKKGALLVGELGHLKMIESVGEVLQDEKDPREDRRVWYLSLGLLAVFFLSLLSALRGAPQMTPKLEEELKQQVVKIVKSMVKPEVSKSIATHMNNETTPTKTTRSQSIKRMGALSALGSLNSSKQRGGLDLSAAQTTAGPGLGGTQGSGGVQTSLYAKGIVSAPLGAGANVQGAGGYGTKGKGGGQAGYGKLALTGSTGVSAIPLGAEATVAKGLDRDQIAAVINRNQGQIRFCYEQGLQSDPALNGRVAVDFTIGGNGLVKEAAIESSTLKAKTVEECILMRLKSWKFPLPDGGVDVKVSYPFTLRRSGQG
jgi:hypothetical protein